MPPSAAMAVADKHIAKADAMVNDVIMRVFRFEKRNDFIKISLVSEDGFLVCIDEEVR